MNIDIEKIKGWLDNYNITNYEILDNGTINLDKYLDLQFSDLKEFPDYIKFNRINSYINISNNPNLKSLKGLPEHISGSLYVKKSGLISLEGAPKYIGGDFNISNNKLSNLKGFPKEVKGWVMIGENYTNFNEEEIKEISKIDGEILAEVSHLFDDI